MNTTEKKKNIFAAKQTNAHHTKYNKTELITINCNNTRSVVKLTWNVHVAYLSKN